MKRCLSERALVRLYLREGTATQQFHLRMCADCAERYEQLVGDLDTISQVLEAPPPVGEIGRASLLAATMDARRNCMCGACCVGSGCDMAAAIVARGGRGARQQRLGVRHGLVRRVVWPERRERNSSGGR